MAVNPQLATLMRVIEDQQDKMQEGEYLAAMNALGALHRQSTVAPAAAVIQPVPQPRPAEPVNLFASHLAEVSLELEQMSRDDRLAIDRVKRMFPEHRQMTLQQWMALSEEHRRRLNIESVEKLVDMKESSQRNPNPRVCPFIARHAVGSWRLGSEYPSHTKEWSCVCGYTGKTKHWKKHEESERHQEWAKHRTVSRRTIEKMKTMILDDEAGDFIPLKPHSSDRSGIRCFTVSQEKNEWTHPEMYMDFHLSPNSEGKWFVHRREDWARIYIQ
jgi:hypothetical protein